MGDIRTLSMERNRFSAKNQTL